MVAMSPSSTSPPLVEPLTGMLASSAGVRRSPRKRIEVSPSGPSIVPAGMSSDCLASAAATSPMVSPKRCRATAGTSMEISRPEKPPTLTCEIAGSAFSRSAKASA